MALVLLVLEGKMAKEDVDECRSFHIILREKDGERRFVVDFSFESSFCFDVTESNNKKYPTLYHFFLQTLKTMGIVPKYVTILDSLSEENYLQLEISFRHHDGTQWLLPVTALDGLNIAFCAGCPLLIDDAYLTMGDYNDAEFVEEWLKECVHDDEREESILSLEDAERRIREDDDLPLA